MTGKISPYARGLDEHADEPRDLRDIGGDRTAPISAGSQSASYGDTATPITPTEPRGDDGHLVRYEEELEVEKAARQTGEVSIRKDLIEETRTIEVPVAREQVRIERRPVNSEATGTSALGEEAFSRQRVSVPVMEETVEVRKVARPVEEIEVGKVPIEEMRQVDDTVRKERFDLEDTTHTTHGQRVWVESKENTDD